MLKLPPVKQLASWDCGPAVVRCLLNFFGCKVPQALAARLTATPHEGTDPAAIQGYLYHAGFRFQLGTMAVADLRHHTGLGRPVITLATLGGVGHYLIVAGVERKRVHYVCPADGPGRMRQSDFETCWFDVGRFGAEYWRYGLAAWKE